MREAVKCRSDMGYFDSLFSLLDLLRYQEVDWARQKYSSVHSAANSIRAAAKKRHLTDVNVRIWNDRLFVFKAGYLGMMPCDSEPTLENAFKKADTCLRNNVLIESWPIPEWLIPKDENLTDFQIGMKLRDELKATYPYLTISPREKNGYSVKRDKSYGSLCKEVKPNTYSNYMTAEELKKTIDLGDLADIVVADTIDSTSEEQTPVLTPVVVKETSIPPVPFDIAASLAEHLCKKGHRVSMTLSDMSGECYASVIFE